MLELLKGPLLCVRGCACACLCARTTSCSLSITAPSAAGLLFPPQSLGLFDDTCSANAGDKGGNRDEEDEGDVEMKGMWR